MSGDLFVALVIVLQSLATGTYLAAGDWKQAIVWGGVAVSNLAYLSLTRS
jgi:hypothetical protein